MSELDKKLRKLSEASALIEAEKLVEIRKAITSTDPVSIVRASAELERMNQGINQGQKSMIIDFTDNFGGMGYRDKRIDISYDVLRQMARTPIIKAAVGTRLSQVESFSSVSNDDNSLGWRIRKKQGLFEDKKGDLSDAEKRRIEDLTEYVENLGVKDDKNETNRGSFPEFLQLFAKDSLELDQATFEIVHTRRGTPHHFIATDASTYRMADPYSKNYENEQRQVVRGVLPSYVQLYEGRVYTDFYPWELCFGVRNKTTDIHNYGYGTSELEDLIRIVTWMLNSDDYNGKFFSQGAAPKGILHLSKNVGNKELLEFRSMWAATVAGVQNAWRTPVLTGDTVEWIDMQKANSDMQFHTWVEYLIRVAAAVYKIDPTEMGFHLQGMSGQGMYSSTKQKTEYSKDKGLFPLLKFIERGINKYVISKIDHKYEFVFIGLNARDEEASIDLDVKRVSNYMTLDEIRQKRGLPPLGKDRGGDIILNSMYIQYLGQLQMGNPESNEYMDMNDEDGSAGNLYEENPFDQFEDIDEEDDTSKANPWVKELNEWIDKGMPNQMLINDNVLAAI